MVVLGRTSGSGKRQRLVDALDRAGVLRGVMQVRRFVPLPIVSVVTFHHVHDTESERGGYPYDPEVADATPRQLRRRLEMLARIGTPITMAELLSALDGAALPPNPVMVTFDDGYRSCHDVALPILRELGIPATFFIATWFVTERRLYWWERIAFALGTARRRCAKLSYPMPLEIDAGDLARARRRLDDVVRNTRGIDIERFLAELCAALDVEWSRAVDAEHADRLIMTWDQIRALERAGMTVESHTRYHHVLDNVDDDTLRDELVGSRDDLERELGHPVHAIAYPVGRRTGARTRDAVARAGYRVGFANSNGVNVLWPVALRGTLAFDPLDLRRVSTSVEMPDSMFLTQLAVPALAY